MELVGERGNLYLDSRSIGNLGVVIVRTRLESGVKFVSIESSLSISNTSDLELVFEMMREKDGVSVIWRSCLPHSAPGKVVPVPADLAVPTYTKTCKLFVSHYRKRPQSIPSNTLLGLKMILLVF